jgi:hypothetical protein
MNVFEKRLGLGLRLGLRLGLGLEAKIKDDGMSAG